MKPGSPIDEGQTGRVPLKMEAALDQKEFDVFLAGSRKLGQSNGGRNRSFFVHELSQSNDDITPESYASAQNTTTLIIGEWSKIKMEDGFKQFLVLTLPELMLEDGISKSQMAEITQSPNSWASVLSNAVAQCFILYPVKK